MIVKNVEKKENNTALLQVEVDAESFEKAVNSAYKKLKGSIYVAGFRKGKAPRVVIEGMYGSDIFHDEAVQILAPEAFEYAVEQEKLDTVGVPSIADYNVDDAKALTITFHTELYPVVTLGQYKGLEVPQNHETFDESKVDEEMRNVQKRNARLIDVEREAKLGDHTTIDFAGFIDGEQFDGGTAENYDIELGSNTFVPGFEEQIVGMKAGDERDVVVTFPENYVAELAGKEATFKVTVKSVKEPELPELDDELAKDISDYETIAEYRDHVREELEKEFTEQQESDYATRLMKAAVDNMTVEIPEPMILAKLDEQLRNYISTMGVSPELTREQVLASMGLDEKTFQEIMRPQAMFEISTDLLLDAIVKAENIELGEGELDEMYQKMADEYKMEVDQIKQYVDEKIIVLDMKRRKAAQLIRDTAVDKEPEAKEEAAETKEEAAE